MNDAAFVVGHARPLRRVALAVAIIALAHPQEARSDPEGVAGVGAHALDRPSLVLPRPRGAVDAVAVADMAREVVLLDHLAHVGQDFLRRRDRLAGPRLEAIAEGVEVAVRADAGIAMGEPGAAEALLRLQHHEAGARELVGQVIGATDARDAGADDQHVDMVGGLGSGRRQGNSGIGHGRSFRVMGPRYGAGVIGLQPPPA